MKLISRLEKLWNGMLLSTRQICIKVMEHLTRKNVKAKVKYIIKEYKKVLSILKKKWISMMVLIYIEMKIKKNGVF